MSKHIIYLASGSSRRFGGNKLLHLLDGKPMYLYGLETLKMAIQGKEDCALTVVSRYDAIRQTAEEMGFRAVDSPDSGRGISYSIRAGLNAIGKIGAEDFVMFAVADQPYLSVDSVERLLALAKEDTACASLCWGERPGNPTLFSAPLIPELMALEGDTGGRRVLKSHPCIFVQACSLRELEDIDVRG